MCKSEEIITFYKRQWSFLYNGQRKMNVRWNRSRNMELDLWVKAKRAFPFEHNRIIFVRKTSSSLWAHPGRMKPVQKAQDQHIKSRAEEQAENAMPEGEGLQDYWCFHLAFPSETMTYVGRGGSWHRDSSCWNMLLRRGFGSSILSYCVLLKGTGCSLEQRSVGLVRIFSFIHGCTEQKSRSAGAKHEPPSCRFLLEWRKRDWERSEARESCWERKDAVISYLLLHACFYCFQRSK